MSDHEDLPKEAPSAGMTRERRQLLAVRELGRIMRATVDVDHLLALLLARLTRILDAERATIYLLSEDRRELVSAHTEGGTVSPIRLVLGSGIAGWVAETGKTVNLPDAYADPRFNAVIDQGTGFRTESLLCMSLADHEGHPVGVVQVLNKRGGPFDADDEAVLATVAAHAAISIENTRLYQERLRSGRLASLGQLLSGVLHDLRTPMTVIAGYAELMAIEQDAAARSEHAAAILKQIELLEAMTHEVLAFARGESNLLIRKVHLNKFIEEVRRHLEKEFEGRSISVEIDLQYSGVAFFDELKLMRAVHNLARNAAQAMESGGRFIITVERSGPTLTMRFEDTGPGIPEEVQPRLFQAFATSGKRDGTGLGLAMVKKIVDEHKGHVAWETARGRGTAFTIAIPADRAP